MLLPVYYVRRLSRISSIAGSDWMIEVGPGAGNEGGRIVVSGPPLEVARQEKGRTAPYLVRYLGS